MRRFAGFGVGLDFGVHAQCLKNLARGIVERVFYVVRGEGLGKVPQPKVGVFDRLSSIRQRLVGVARRTPVVDREKYPELYTGRKRLIYQRAVDSLATEAISPRDAVVSTFVKAEKINLSSKVDPAPRVIQPRTARYNVEVGRYLKLFEKSLCSAFVDVFGYRVILKGLNASEVASELRSSWDHYSSPIAVGLDASRFDQHVSVEALTFEHSVYNGVFRSGELRELLSWQLHNTGVAFADGVKVCYDVDGKRMSGDINTGMGNCLLMSSMVLGFCESVGLDARLANNGDDCVLIFDSSQSHLLAGIDQWMLDFGFTLTREEAVDVFERISFCQAQPVFTADGWRMVRDPFVSMSKDMVSLHGWSSSCEVAYWLHTVGVCGQRLTAGVPVLDAWYSSLVRFGREAPEAWVDSVGRSGFWYMARGLRCKSAVIDEARVSFWRAFGVTPDEQVALEAVYQGWECPDLTPGPMMLTDITALDHALNPLSLT